MSACPDCGRRYWYGHPTRCPSPGRRLLLPHADQAAWFERTGHCGFCGQPGAYCLCTDRDPCGCAHLHEVGSGIGRDPTEVFADAFPAIDDQTELF